MSFTGAEPWIDVQESLHPVSVVGVQMSALSEDWAQPHRRHAEALR
jgi:hypothetical protein